MEQTKMLDELNAIIQKYGFEIIKSIELCTNYKGLKTTILYDFKSPFGESL